MPVKRKRGNSMAKDLAVIKTEVKALHKGFSEHTESEAKWQTSVDVRLDRMEGRFNNIELNGDGKKYTIEEALRAIFALVKPLKIRKEFGRRWSQLRDSVPMLHFMFATKPGKAILFALWLYFSVSVLGDFGFVHDPPLVIVWNLLKLILPKIG